MSLVLRSNYFFIISLLVFNFFVFQGSSTDSKLQNDVSFILSVENEGIYSLSNCLTSLRDEILNYKEEVIDFTCELIITEIGKWNEITEEIVKDTIGRQYSKFQKLDIIIKVVRNENTHVREYHSKEVSEKYISSISKQLNKAVSNSDGRLLIFVSSILEVEENWLASLISPISEFTASDLLKANQLIQNLTIIDSLHAEKAAISKRISDLSIKKHEISFLQFQNKFSLEKSNDKVEIQAGNSTHFFVKLNHQFFVYRYNFQNENENEVNITTETDATFTQREYFTIEKIICSNDHYIDNMNRSIYNATLYTVNHDHRSEEKIEILFNEITYMNESNITPENVNTSFVYNPRYSKEIINMMVVFFSIDSGNNDISNNNNNNDNDNNNDNINGETADHGFESIDGMRAVNDSNEAKEIIQHILINTMYDKFLPLHTRMFPVTIKPFIIDVEKIDLQLQQIFHTSNENNTPSVLNVSDNYHDQVNQTQNWVDELMNQTHSSLHNSSELIIDDGKEKLHNIIDHVMNSINEEKHKLIERNDADHQYDRTTNRNDNVNDNAENKVLIVSIDEKLEIINQILKIKLKNEEAHQQLYNQDHKINEDIASFHENIQLLRSSMKQKSGITGSFILTKNNRIYDAISPFYFTPITQNKEKKSGFGFTPNNDQYNHLVPKENPPLLSSFDDPHHHRKSSLRNLIYNFAKSLNGLRSGNFNKMESTYTSQNNPKMSHYYPVPFVDYQGEHKDYEKLQSISSQSSHSIFVLSSLSFALPRCLFFLVGGFDENYQSVGSTGNSNSIEKLSPLAFHNYAILELNLVIESLGLNLHFQKESKARLSQMAPTFDFFHHLNSNNNQNVESLLSDFFLFQKRWNSLLLFSVNSRYLESSIDVVWDMECGTSGVLGFTTEAINLLGFLEKYVPLSITTGQSDTSCFLDLQSLGLPTYKVNLLNRLYSKSFLLSQEQQRKEILLIVHRDPGRYQFFSSKHSFNPFYVVGRSMFETNSIPAEWKRHIEENVDELWVPTQFNVESFLRGGLSNSTSFYILPNSIDADSFSPSLFQQPIFLPKIAIQNFYSPLPNLFIISDFSQHLNFVNQPFFTFLSVMKWEERKGWKELLASYASEFSSEERVQLVIRTNIRSANNERDLLEFLSQLREAMQIETLPKIVIIDQIEKFWRLPEIYSEADCFVLSSHGEGWGLPYSEAMSMKLPTIGTNWSGNTAFMNLNNSYLINVFSELIPSLTPDNYWANIDQNHLRYLMRTVYNQKSDESEKTTLAREEIKKYDPSIVARNLAYRIKDIASNWIEYNSKSKARKASFTAPTPTPTKPTKVEGKEKYDSRKYPQTREINGKTFYLMRILDI